MAENTTEIILSTASPSPGWDDLTEDLFGLNIRGLVTIRDIFIRPAKVYEAARTSDWKEKYYTPSIRLFFSLITAVILLRVLWAGEDTHFVQMMELQLQASIPEGEAISSAMSATAVIQQMLVSLPVMTMISMLLTGMVLRIWGKGTSLPVRLRNYFIAATPGWILSYLIFVLLEFATFELYVMAYTLVYVIILAADISTAFRGGVQAKTSMGRFGKATLFGITNFAAYVLASTLMGVYAVYAISTAAT